MNKNIQLSGTDKMNDMRKKCQQKYSAKSKSLHLKKNIDLCKDGQQKVCCVGCKNTVKTLALKHDSDDVKTLSIITI